MCGESFLPCLIGKLHDGDFQGKHSVYIQIAYIDITQVSGLSPTLKGAPMG